MNFENEETETDNIENPEDNMPEEAVTDNDMPEEDILENDMPEEDAPDENRADSRKKKISGKRIMAEICIYAVMLFLCVFIVPKYVIQRTVVSGSSMLNTLHNNESILVEKISYKFTDPGRFDIIVFYPYGRDDPDDYYVKRIIGLPGETIQIIGDTIYINGQVLEENYGKDPITDEGIAAEAITLADDEYFVLGDNREISEDSRIFGPVKRVNIAGHAVFRIYPFDKFGTLTNK